MLDEETMISRLARELREETEDLQESLENLAAEDYDLWGEVVEPQ